MCVCSAATLLLADWCVQVNLARDPRWGRIEETPGEDPVLNGEYAVAFTQGVETAQLTDR